MKKPLISFQNFTFTYSDQNEPVLNELDVTIYEGEKILVVGPSGSGKTTFARCLTGILPNKENDDYTGTITIGDSFENGSIRNFLPNELAISMEEDAETLHKKKREGEVSETVQTFQTYVEQKKLASMNWFLSKTPSLLDSFNKLTSEKFKKMLTAGMFLNDKPLLVFDEPLANLDPRSSDEAMDFIDALHNQTDTTIVIIEHRLEDALVDPIDRLILFSEGRIIADGEPADVLKSDVLADIGIREPLYITAMRYAGVNLDHVRHLDNVNKINAPHLKEEMERWLSYLPHFRYSPNGDNLLEIKNLDFKYPWNEKNVLKNINLTIKEGEMLSVVGPNGSGKSTLARLITGQEKIQTGQIFWKGEEITDLDPEKMAQIIGYIPQNPLDYISKDYIYDEIAYRLKDLDLSAEEVEKRVENVIHVCSLQYIRDLPMTALSFGQLRRVVIASALAFGPEMIIVDEPSASQDFMRYTEIMTFLESIHLKGVTVLLVTHDMHLMLEYTKRAIVMTDGEVIADTSPVYLLANPELVKQSSLKETSLFTFAENINMQDPYAFTEKFIHYDRVARMF